jgi:hypothetical protein
MGNRYLKSEVAALKAMYASATKAEIMAELPGRNWIVVCRYARFRLGLYRSRKAKGLAITAGRLKGQRKREEEKIKK